MNIECLVDNKITHVLTGGYCLSLPQIGNRFVLFDKKTNQPILTTTTVKNIWFSYNGLEIETLDFKYTIS